MSDLDIVHPTVRLFNKCAMAVASVLAESSGITSIGPDTLEIVRKLLTNQHNGKVGENGSYVEAIFLDQNRLEPGQWRVRMVTGNKTYGNTIAARGVVVTPEEVPAGPGTALDSNISWLLYPKYMRCMRHKNGDTCPFCQNKVVMHEALFDEDMPEIDVVAMVAIANMAEAKTLN